MPIVPSSPWTVSCSSAREATSVRAPVKRSSAELCTVKYMAALAPAGAPILGSSMVSSVAESSDVQAARRTAPATISQRRISGLLWGDLGEKAEVVDPGALASAERVLGIEEPIRRPGEHLAGVLDGVVVAFAFLERHRDPDSHLGGFELLGSPGQTYEARVELVQELAQDLGCVALGVDGHEDHHRRLGDLGKLIEGLGDLGEMHRADVGAVRVAEVQEGELAAGRLGEMERVPVGVGEGEVR